METKNSTPKSLLVVATQHGVFTFVHVGDNWEQSDSGLMDHGVTSVIAREGVILAGTSKGVFRSDDLGKTWYDTSAGLTLRNISWMAYHPDISDFEFAGTEPAGIYVSRDGAATWRECIEVAVLRNQHNLDRDSSLSASRVRSFAFHGFRAYVAIENGFVLRSDDRGETWRLADVRIGGQSRRRFLAPHFKFEINSIFSHPISQEVVFAATSKGYYRSFDGGNKWELLFDCYCRAAWVNPNDVKHHILGPADNADADGRIEETSDGGRAWHLAIKGISVPWSQFMVERFFQINNELFALLSNGVVFCTSLMPIHWRQILGQVHDVTSIASLGP